MSRPARELKQIASILTGSDADKAYKLTVFLNMPEQPITGKTAAIEQETPLFGGKAQIEQVGLFADQEESQ